MSDKGKGSIQVQVKAKSDPEALLNDLSSSLKTFQSTVRSWTTKNTNTNITNVTGSQIFPETRPTRLGLGAKAQKQMGAGDSVAGNLALKKQLTSNTTNKNSSKNISQSSGVVKTAAKAHSNVKKSLDDDAMGRATLIQSSKHFKKLKK